MDDVPTIELQEEPDFWISRGLDRDFPIRATVIVPTFDTRTTLHRALQSAFDQTMRDIEVIVVDDASTDSSWSMIGSWLCRDQRLRAIKNKKNCGKPVGMNRAIGFARGRWLAVLDADDWYHPDRLSALIALGEERQADMVADNQYFYDAPADQIVGTAWPRRDSAWELTFDDFLSAANAYETFNLGMLKPVIRTDFVRRKSLSYEERARHGQDFFYLLQFYLSGGRAAIADTPYYYYTQPFGIVSHCWSHPARKRYDFQTAYEINRRYLGAMAGKLPSAQIARLERRNDRLKSLEYFYRAKECLNAGDWIGAAAKFGHQPAMLGYIFRRLQNRIFPRPPSVAIERIAAHARKRKPLR
jgi:succinoglycan biosynthesis protein ExoO